MSEITPQQQLDLARRNLSARLAALGRRSLNFSAAQVLDMHDLLDEFADDAHKAAMKRKAASRESD